jgi:hypothetical protein
MVVEEAFLVVKQNSKRDEKWILRNLNVFISLRIVFLCKLVFLIYFPLLIS